MVDDDLDRLLADDDLDRPLADIRRVRHADSGRYHGIHGKTARKIHWRSPQAELGSENYSWNKCLYSAFELAGRDSLSSLNRDLAWEHVPRLLEAHSIAPPFVRKASDGTITTWFQLEPEVEVVFDARADGAAQHGRPAANTDGKLYRLKNGKRPNLFAIPPTEAPEWVRGKLLAPARMGDCRNGRSMPLVRREAAWDVHRHGGVGAAKLDIDLGADCIIYNIATQGRSPPTRVYPAVRRERRGLHQGRMRTELGELGRRALRTAMATRREEQEAEAAAGDHYWVEGRRWDLIKHGQYPGPFWDVLDLKGDVERCPRTGRAYLPRERWLQWVSRYEVHYRTDGGRQWHSLGVYKGNQDATSEVAHDVGGVRARYLRITPLEVEGLGALRVGVYGQTASATTRDGEPDATDSAEAPDPITYRLTTIPDGLNTRYTHDERYTYRGGKHARDKWNVPYKYTGAAQRYLSRLVQEHLLDGTEETEWLAESTGQEEEGAAPSPRRPLLADWIASAVEGEHAMAEAGAPHDQLSVDVRLLDSSDASSEWSEVDAWSEVDEVWSELSPEERWLQVAAFTDGLREEIAVQP